MENIFKYKNIKIDEVCRICLVKKDEMNLIYEAGLADMLLECASVQVTPENGLFNLVCNYCANEVSRWFIFKQRVIQSFEIGRILLEKKETERADVNNDFTLHISQEPTKSNNMENKFISENIADGDCTMLNESLKISINKNELEDMHLHMCEYVQVNQNDQSTIIDTVLGNQNVEWTQRKDLQCKICSRQCTTTNSYNRHVKTHDTSRPYICSKCEKSFKTSQVLSEHMRRHYDDRRHRCLLCSQKFYSKASLNDHMRSHTGEKPFKCNICSRAFGTKAILRQHQIVHSVREKRYLCDICNKFLLSAGSLVTHKRKHTGIKPFLCLACDKQFFTKEAMQRHFSAIHDTDNNFLCNICSKVCSTKVHLNNHIKKNHSGLGKSSNTMCSVCGKQCGSVAELKVHIRVHTGERPYVCDICDKKFIAKGNLNSHKHRHTGNKPYLCNHCGKAFAEKSTLKVHQRIHTGEQPFKCNICEKSYVQSSALRTHMKSH